jgi:Zn-dependent protease with chaperone function
VYLPSLLMTSVASQNIQILALFVGGLVIAGAMLWSLVPKRIKFEVPGLLLDGAAQPRLFSEINAIAAALNEPMPSEVYLIGDVNAFVAERGGFMGFRTRRVLAIGLPLFAAMSISEMRGVLAHEFAHYDGGDTRLGPFVYRVKDTIFRTFRNIEAVGVIGKVAIIRLLYTVVVHLLSWYFRVFLRAINFVSRKQEFRADELACYVAGGNSMAQGLRKLRAGSLAWHFYWFGELAPVVAENALPPIGEGFATLLDHSEITEAIRQAAESQIENGETSPYDTHPPMRERLAAIEGLQIQAKETNHEPALSLLADGANVWMP